MQPAMPSMYSYVGARLERGVAFLETLELLREFAGDPVFGAAEESNVISREIIDLELLEADCEIQRICDATGAGDQASGSMVVRNV